MDTKRFSEIFNRIVDNVNTVIHGKDEGNINTIITKRRPPAVMAPVKGQISVSVPPGPTGSGNCPPGKTPVVTGSGLTRAVLCVKPALTQG